MSNFAKRIINNSFWLIAGEVVSKISTFIFLAIVARKIGVENFGKFNFALSFIIVVTLLNDLGLTNYLFRELARNRSEKNRYIVNICIIRFTTLVVFALGIAIYLKIMNISREVGTLIYIFLIWYFIFSYLSIFRKSFRAIEMMSTDTLINAIDNTSRLFFVIVFLKMGFGTNGVALAYVTGSLVAVLISIVIYIRNFGKLFFSLDLALWKHAFSEMKFLAVSALFLGLFGFFDVLILSRYQSLTDVGIFSASFKLVWMILMIPCLITEAAFPRLSQLAFDDKNKFARLVSYLLKGNLIIALGISIITCIFADKIILVVYGSKYIQSAIVLRILIWYLVLYSLNIIFIYGITAINKQNINAILLGCAIIINIILDIIFSKKYSYMGLPFASIISALILLLGYIFYYVQHNIIDSKALKLSYSDLRLIREILRTRDT